MSSFLGLGGCVLLRLVLVWFVSIDMFEETLRELLDLGHILFHIFLVKVLLHDPEIGRRFLSCGIVCRNDVLWPDSIFGECRCVPRLVVLEEAKVSSSRHMRQSCLGWVIVEDYIVNACKMDMDWSSFSQV